MRRVYTIYALRVLGKPVTRFAILVAAVAAIGLSVSLSSVAANTLMAASSATGLLTFMIDAFFSTETLTQALALVAFLVVVFALKDATAYLLSGVGSRSLTGAH